MERPIYTLTAMTEDCARRISLWKYPGEYHIYSFEGSREDIAELMCGEYRACLDASGALAGFFCFGASARIPSDTDYSADGGHIDIGLGMQPELCGKGLGRTFLESGMAYAKESFSAKGLRLVVACFNKRAVTLYSNCGFIDTGTVTHSISRAPFLVMKREF